MTSAADHQTEHFRFEVSGPVATVTLNRPERKNPLTFESYRELADTFRAARDWDDCQLIVLTGAGGNFSSGGDVHEIIGPLTEMAMPELLRFTRMTGDLVLAMRGCPQPIIAAVSGVCAGAGAIMAMASDLRIAGPDAKCAFLFTRVGLAGADMGACAILPRIVGQGRAAELLYLGRSLSAEEGLAWGFWNQVADDPLAEATVWARRLADGPTFAHRMTKTQLDREWDVSLDTAIEMEAQAQAICMKTNDFRRAYEAFAAKQRPVFEGD